MSCYILGRFYFYIPIFFTYLKYIFCAIIKLMFRQYILWSILFNNNNKVLITLNSCVIREKSKREFQSIKLKTVNNIFIYFILNKLYNLFKYYDNNNNLRLVEIFSEILYDFQISSVLVQILSLNYTLKIYINHVQSLFLIHTKTENLSDGSRRAFSMPRKTNETHRFVSPRFSLNFFGHRQSVRQFTSAFYRPGSRWTSPVSIRWSSLTNQKFLSGH